MDPLDKFRPNESALIRAGKHAGMVGTVLDVRDDGTARVLLEGVKDGEPIKAALWFKRGQLERPNA